jgi:hypothetical protein
MGRMPFGKYRGWPLCEVPTSYLAWVLRECSNIHQELREAIEEDLESRKVRTAYGTRQPREGSAGPPADWDAIVRRWYRELALVHHPDRGGSVTAMQIVNDAHERLRKLVGV